MPLKGHYNIVNYVAVYQRPNKRKIMKNKESDLQIRCVTWFRYQFPQFARLLEHPKNEGNGNRRQGSIAKAEGVQAGVADLILHVPAVYLADEGCDEIYITYHSLAVEMKTKTGYQSPGQKEWQQYFEAAGGLYIVVRSYDDFVDQVSRYMSKVLPDVSKAIQAVYASIQKKADEEAKEQFRKLLNK